MSLSADLISQLVKVTNDDTSSESAVSTTVYGTAKKVGGSWYVLVDGSEQLVPMTSTASVSDGDRVIMTIENHVAVVTGNLTDQAASSADVSALTVTVEDLGTTITANDTYLTLLQSVISIVDSTVTAEDALIKIEDGEVIIQGISIDSLNDTINSQDNKITTIENDISLLYDVISIEGSTVTISGVDITALYDTVESQGNSITALNNVITIEDDTVTIKGVDITALYDTVVSQGNTITSLNNTITAQDNTISVISSTIDIYNSSFQITNGVVTGIKGVDTDWITTEDLEADHATIESLNTTYANIDFSNIGQAAIEYFYATSGIIEDLVIGDTTVTGKLVGITITGDLIEANTIVADKLVVLGEDGLYYALNFNGESVETEQTEYNSINGSLITANTITASKINVDDLVAFDATIGGFNITDNSLYSGVKESVDNTTRGVYMDSDGQLCFGDDSNYVKYYYDEEDNTYKLTIRAGSISLGASNTSLEDSIDALNEAVETLADEITTSLKIMSSRGTVFKNNSISTVLTVVIYRGSQTISDSDTLHEILGSSAYLEWKYRGVDDDDWHTIVSTDSRLGDDGFTFTLSPDDIDTQMTFTCELNV